MSQVTVLLVLSAHHLGVRLAYLGPFSSRLLLDDSSCPTPILYLMFLYSVTERRGVV